MWGAVVGDDRGSLPFALIHGESLVACASWALGQVEDLVLVGSGVTHWQVLVDAGASVVLHDVACPMTPTTFLEECVARSLASGTVVVAVRPVTDTVKAMEGDAVGHTVDREGLRSVSSPVVLPPGVVADLEGWPESLPDLVSRLASRGPVEFVEAPPEARRVADPEDLRLLEALTVRAAPRPA